MFTIRSSLILAVAFAGLGACGEAEPAAQHLGHSAGVPSRASCPPDNSLNYQNFGQPFMDAYCTECHSSARMGEDRQGAPLRHDFDTLEGIRDLLIYVDGYAAAGPSQINRTMPPPSSPSPSDAERRKLGQWLACGAQ